MDNAIHTHTLCTQSYGNLTYHGLISEDNQNFLSSFSNFSSLRSYSLNVALLELYSSKLKERGFFVCVDALLFQTLIKACTRGDFESIILHSQHFKDCPCVLPLLIKHSELTCAGKKDVYAIEFNLQGRKHYCFNVSKSIFRIFFQEIRKDLRLKKK